jgi:hypothetical protein
MRVRRKSGRADILHPTDEGETVANEYTRVVWFPKDFLIAVLLSIPL